MSLRMFRLTERGAVCVLDEQACEGLGLDQLAGLVQVVVDHRIRIDANGVIDGREQLAGMDRVLHGSRAGLVGLAMNMTALDARAGDDAAWQAVMTHGGMGYAREYHVERYFREIQIARIAPVSPQLILSHIAERVLGLPKSY